MAAISSLQISGEQLHSIVIAALGVVVIGLVFNTLRSPLAKVPGPWYSTFTSLVLTNHWLKGTRASYVHMLHLKYGPLVRIAPNEIDVMDVPSAKEIHTVKATYIKAPFYTDLAPVGVEDLVSTRDINFHRRHRRLLQGPFSETSLKAFYPLVEKRVEMAVQRIGEEMSTRGVADVFKWFLFLTTDVIGELSFGESFHMLETGKKNQYSINLEKLAAILGLRSTFPTLAKLALYGVPIPGFRENTDNTRQLEQHAVDSLNRYKTLVESNSDKTIPTLFTRLLKGEESEELTFKEILDEARIYIIAGSDTTAVTLTYLVWRVCQDPIVQAKLVEELQQLPKDYNDSDLIKLPYMARVINESLRLHSPVPSGLPRVVPPGGTTMSGHYIPGGSIICTQSWSMHRNPDIYADPETFDPDRWASPTKDMTDSFMAFGGGSRVCIGMHLARLELRLATARFFRAFPNAKVSSREGMCEGDMEQQLYFLAPPKGKRCLIECS